jgi:predicted nucleotidyltransferase
LVSQLLSALKAESNVEVAVLFGATARSARVEVGSDVDLVVGLRRSRPGALEALSHRLAERLRVDIDLVPLGVVLRSPSFLAELLRDGRPVVDREQAWPKLQATCNLTRAMADREGETFHREAVAAVDYFRRIAAERIAAQ